MKHLILVAPFVLAACGSVESTPQVEAFIASDPVAAIEAVKESYEQASAVTVEPAPVAEPAIINDIISTETVDIVE